ncbi:helix-turn-helix transcriptional regulator [Nocardioides sp. Leaf307]|uniref:helix-turn-helix transcriptional regulator n=1 Tax=Nocardioides sp. Leaf307 TaxID=1736331 RepID=UPI00070388A5|nr:response regulator transcription factor [Nocardioides sp. Leaf307]KQQ42890.1 hypothetical protein ASF50_02395 [Nocardioides sp. Leaf307]
MNLTTTSHTPRTSGIHAVPQKRPLVVALVDDHPFVAAGVAALLAPHTDRVQLVDTETALDDPAAVDVVLYEPVKLSQTGQNLVRRLATSGQARPVVYTWRDPQAPGSSRAQVRLSKTLGADELVDAIERALRTTPTAARPSRPLDRTPHAVVGATANGARAGLTPREAEILSLVTQGHTNVEIGKQLYLSINSVKTYIRGAYRKIGVERRTQAVAWGLRHGLGMEPARGGLVDVSAS